jgi:hypothetical protein
MTNTEQKLIGLGIKPENAKKLVDILEEFWKNDNTRHDYYRSQMKAVTIKLSVIALAEESYCEEFADYDFIFRRPRLKTDPLWPRILQMVADVHHTGKCPFCDEKMLAMDGRQICTPCDRAFGIKKKGAFNPADPNTAFLEAVHG